jgi:hypothetical protein
MIKFSYYIFFTIIFTAFMLLSSGCERREGCTDPTSENYDPAADYENNTCIRPRKKFTGLYSSQDNCSSAVPALYEVDILESNLNLDDIIIYNLSGISGDPLGPGRFNYPVVARVQRNQITIQRQMPDANGRYIEGTGSIVGNVLTISYEINYGAFSKVCVATMTK